MKLKDLPEIITKCMDVITKCKDVPYVRVLKLARILACVLLLLAWFCAHVVNLYAIFLPADTLNLMHQLVLPDPYRAFLHVHISKVFLVFILLSLGAPKINREGTWSILRTIYEVGESLTTIYFIVYAINCNLEFVSGHGSLDPIIVAISIFYLLVYVFTRRYSVNTRLFANVVKKYPLSRRTGYVDINGKEICEDDILKINAKLYTIVRFPKDRNIYVLPKGIKVFTYQDVFPLDDVAGKYPIEIFDDNKERPEK